MKLKMSIMVFIMSFLLCGCNAQELEDRAFVMLLGIEKADDYTVTLNIAQPKSDSTDPFIIYSKKADTIYDALDEINKDTSGELYLGHTQAILVNSNMQKELNNLLNKNINIGRDIPVIKCDDIKKVMTLKNDKINIVDYISQYFENYDYKKISLDAYINSDITNLPILSVIDNNYLLH